jgi:heavy metal sensor kinase
MSTVRDQLISRLAALRQVLTSVRVRLTLWYVAILTLVLVIFSVGVYLFLVESIDADIANTVRTEQQRLIKAAEQSPEHPSLGKILLQGGSASGLTLAYYSSATGQQTIVGNLQSHSLSTAMLSTLFSNKQGCHKTKGDGLQCTWIVQSPHNRNQPLGAGGLQISLNGVTRAQDRLRTAMILGVPISILIALIGGWILASRALSPVEELRRTAQSITATDLSRRIDLRRNDELGRLAETLNDMISRLDTAFREQRQLTADVSHELRTPLAVIQAQTSLALRRRRSAQEYAAVLTSIQEETERLSRMVGDLLLLARAEAGQETIQREPVRLDHVARWCVDQVKNVAQHKGVHLRLIAEPALLEGDTDRLRQLVLNLVDNAIKYTPSDGRVLVVVKVSGEHAVLRVADTGEGMDPESLPYIFQRFYRGDRARTRGESGSGLGLAIARWVAEAHGGTIEVKSKRGSGSVFTVHLPLHAAQVEQLV